MAQLYIKTKFYTVNKKIHPFKGTQLYFKWHNFILNEFLTGTTYDFRVLTCINFHSL